MIRAAFIVLLLTSAFSSFVTADDKILVSNPKSTSSHSGNKQQQIQEAIAQYVQQVIFYRLLEDSMEMMKRVNESSSVKLMPAVGYLAAHQIVLQLFEQQPTMETLRSVFTDVYEASKKEQEEGVSPDKLQQNIKSTVQTKLGSMTSDRVYRYIAEAIINQALQQQTRMIAQQMYQRQYQTMAIQQQAVRLAIEQRFNQMAQAQRQLIQQRANVVEGAYNNQRQDQYQQAFQQYGTALQSQYQQNIQDVFQSQ